MSEEKERKRYSDYYETEFGRKVLELEVEYVMKALGDCRDVLSIGCGPACLEAGLVELKPEMNVVGLDISEEMLRQVPQAEYGLNNILGTAEHVPFKDSSFDATFYVTSLEFIDDHEKAVRESFRILKPKGRLLILMLNTKSNYFRVEYGEVDSYISRFMKHTDVETVGEYVSRWFDIRTEYLLGIYGDSVFDTNDPEWASLYAIKGLKKEDRR